MTAATDRLSPHHRLLLAAVSAATPDLEVLQPLFGSDGFAWDGLVDLAKRNRLTSFVYQLLAESTVTELLDETVLEEWRSLQAVELARVEKKTTQLKEVGEALDRAGVVALVYKGPDFNDRFYSPRRPRAFNDLDIIVRRRQAVAAAEALEAVVYHLPPGTPPLSYFLRFHLHAIYLHPGGGHPVELHWSLDSPYRSRGDLVPLLFEAAVPGHALGAALVRPAPIDTLALMVLHLEKHVGLCACLPNRQRRLAALIDEGGLFWVLDVVRWFQKMPAASSPEALLERVRRLSAERSLVIGLRLAQDVDATCLPPWATELASRLPPERPPIAARVLYPDIREPLRSKTRRWLGTTLPVVAFRPARVVEVFLPRHKVPGVEARRAHLAVSALLHRIGLAVANVLALSYWKLKAWVSPAPVLPEKGAGGEG